MNSEPSEDLLRFRPDPLQKLKLHPDSLSPAGGSSRKYPLCLPPQSVLLPVFPLLYRLSCNRRSHGSLFLRQNPGSPRLLLLSGKSSLGAVLLQRCPSLFGRGEIPALFHRDEIIVDGLAPGLKLKLLLRMLFPQLFGELLRLLLPHILSVVEGDDLGIRS